MRKAIIAFALLSFNGCTALGIGAASGAAAGGVATAKAAENRNYGAGTYVATVLSNSLYVPAKALFAAGGAATSGVAYLATLGDRDVSGQIWRASVGGDYVVTPAVIEGDRKLEFVG